VDELTSFPVDPPLRWVVLHIPDYSSLFISLCWYSCPAELARPIMNTTSSSFSPSSLHSPLIIFTWVLSILPHVAQCLLSLPGRKREKEDKWGGVASERAGEYGVGRAEEVGERQREREGKRATRSISLSFSLRSICHKRRDVVGCCSIESVISEAFPETDPASVTVGRRVSLRSCFCWSWVSHVCAQTQQTQQTLFGLHLWHAAPGKKPVYVCGFS